MQTAALVFCVVVGLLTLVGFGLTLYYAVQTIANRKPGIGLMDDVSWRPLNHIFIKSHLTGRGLEYRRKFGYAAAFYIVAPLVLWVVLYSLVVMGWLK